MSYHPISCRINEAKYFIRIRVTCEIAARLKQSTQTIPANNRIADIVNIANKNAIESFMTSVLLSSIVALVLRKTDQMIRKKHYSIHLTLKISSLQNFSTSKPVEN